MSRVCAWVTLRAENSTVMDSVTVQQYKQGFTKGATHWCNSAFHAKNSQQPVLIFTLAGNSAQAASFVGQQSSGALLYFNNLVVVWIIKRGGRLVNSPAAEDEKFLFLIWGFFLVYLSHLSHPVSCLCNLYFYNPKMAHAKNVTQQQKTKTTNTNTNTNLLRTCPLTSFHLQNEQLESLKEKLSTLRTTNVGKAMMIP